MHQKGSPGSKVTRCEFKIKDELPEVLPTKFRKMKNKYYDDG